MYDIRLRVWTRSRWSRAEAARSCAAGVLGAGLYGAYESADYLADRLLLDDDELLDGLDVEGLKLRLGN